MALSLMWASHALPLGLFFFIFKMRGGIRCVGVFQLRPKHVKRLNEQILEPLCLSSDTDLLLTLFVSLGNLFKLSPSVSPSIKWEYS